jgi:Protein of unknown function (DUF732)
VVRVIRVRRAAPAGALVLAAVLVPPAHADLIDNAFLAALSNADIPYSAPVSTVALGHSICPMLVGPRQSFDSVVSTVADNTGMSTEMSGRFALLAIGEYCPAMLAPLLPLHLQA